MEFLLGVIGGWFLRGAVDSYKPDPIVDVGPFGEVRQGEDGQCYVTVNSTACGPMKLPVSDPREEDLSYENLA